MFVVSKRFVGIITIILSMIVMILPKILNNLIGIYLIKVAILSIVQAL